MMPLIDLRGVSLHRDGRGVLSGLDLRVMTGDRLAIVGPNGVGKTTLLRVIVGLERPDTGAVTLFGQSCRREADFRPHRPRIGFLFQDSDDQLFCPTVAEDVAFGPLNTGASPAQAHVAAIDALTTLGIAHLAQRVTHRLSGGEKRLVCLAGLLAMRPDVLLLDEPTNGIDADNMALLRRALVAYTGAMILVSHDQGFVAEMATRAALMRDGTLIAAEIHTHPHLHSHPHLHPKS
ncbi:MAG TPA: ABC transporter ATP-binding protein [Paenirhodobacter sp.]